MSWEQRAIDRSPAVQRSRQRSVDQAREIISAAIRLLQSGDTDFTVSRLTAEAGIALQTFYRYFSGKDELLLAVLEELIATGTEQMRVRAEAEPDPLARLRAIILPVATGQPRVGDGPPPSVVTHLHFQLQEQNARDVEVAITPFVTLVTQLITEARDAGLIDPLDIDRDAWAITRLVLGHYHNIAVGGMDDEDLQETAEHIWQFSLQALRPVPPPAAGAPTARARSGRPARDGAPGANAGSRTRRRVSR